MIAQNLFKGWYNKIQNSQKFEYTMPFSNLSGCIAPTQQYVAPPLPSKIEGNAATQQYVAPPLPSKIEGLP